MALGSLVSPVAPRRVGVGLVSTCVPPQARAPPAPLLVTLCLLSRPQVEERENEWSVPHCFTIYAAQKTVVVAAR